MSVGAGPFDESVRRAIGEGSPPSVAGIGAMAAEHTAILGAEGRVLAAGGLVDRLVGLGPLTRLARDPTITDLLVNGDGVVWVDRGLGVERSPIRLPVDDLRPLVVRLAGVAGRRLDDAQPWVDGVLPGGVRLHAVLSPLADGPHLSLRFARHRPGGIESLVGLGSLGADLAVLLREVVVALLAGGHGRHRRGQDHRARGPGRRVPGRRARRRGGGRS